MNNINSSQNENSKSVYMLLLVVFSACEEDWVHNDGSCYFIHPQGTRLDWPDANVRPFPPNEYMIG